MDDGAGEQLCTPVGPSLVMPEAVGKREKCHMKQVGRTRNQSLPFEVSYSRFVDLA